MRWLEATTGKKLRPRVASLFIDQNLQFIELARTNKEQNLWMELKCKTWAQLALRRLAKVFNNCKVNIFTSVPALCIVQLVEFLFSLSVEKWLSGRFRLRCDVKCIALKEVVLSLRIMFIWSAVSAFSMCVNVCQHRQQQFVAILFLDLLYNWKKLAQSKSIQCEWVWTFCMDKADEAAAMNWMESQIH